MHNAFKQKLTENNTEYSTYIRIPLHLLVNLIHCRIQIIKSYFTHEIGLHVWYGLLKSAKLSFENVGSTRTTLITSFTKGLEIHVSDSHPHRVAKKLLISTGIYGSRAERTMLFIIIEDIISYYDISVRNPWYDTDPDYIRAGWPIEYSQYIHNDFAIDNNLHDIETVNTVRIFMCFLFANYISYRKCPYTSRLAILSCE